MTVRVYQSATDQDEHDRDFWKTIPPDERISETWRLSEELWRLKGDFNDEPGLCRTVARIRRR